MSLKYTLVIEGILCLIFSMCVATMHHINHSGQESKSTLQFMIVIYLWPFCYELLGYNQAKFEIPSLHNVHQKANFKVFVKSEKTKQQKT